MLRNKSCGPDGVPNEVLSLPELRGQVLSMLNQMLISVTPASKLSFFVPLPKKGDLTLPSNWRGITLEQHMTKLFNKLIQRRLATALDKYLLCEQSGFREGRSTREQIMCHSLLVSDARRFKHRQLYGTYIDFAKAFDSVPRWAIAAALRSWHTPEAVISQILSIIVGHQVRFQTTCDVAPIDVQVGVLQGDTLSPFLFVLVIDAILRHLYDLDGLKGPQEGDCMQIRFLAYADDIALLCSTPEALQKMFLRLEAISSSIGMRLNYGKGKTECFSVNGVPFVLKNRLGAQIPQMSNRRRMARRALRAPLASLVASLLRLLLYFNTKKE